MISNTQLPTVIHADCLEASETVDRYLHAFAVVVYESTVYSSITYWCL